MMAASVEDRCWVLAQYSDIILATQLDPQDNLKTFLLPYAAQRALEFPFIIVVSVEAEFEDTCSPSLAKL